MTPRLLDLSEQFNHVLDVMLAILQPALWLGLCAGFVLASAHLLTMLGTRWGDRRVSPKALFFSLLIHLSLGVAVVAMIPEYRQHILSLGQGDQPPVPVELLARVDTVNEPRAATGNQPAWEQLPEQLRIETKRSAATAVEPERLVRPERDTPIQLAELRPPESPLRPTAPDAALQPIPATPLSAEHAPAPASLPVDVLPAEARAEIAMPQPELERTAPPRPMPATEALPAGRPPELESFAERPPQSLFESPLASLSPPLSGELPRIVRVPLPANVGPASPAAEPLPLIQPSPGARPTPATAGNSAADSRGPQRTRSQAVAMSQDQPLQRFRPGVIPMDSPVPPRERDRAPLPRRDDATLPDLYRPVVDPQQALAAVGAGRVPASYGLRTDQDRKDEAIRKFGGTEDSQKAVERALRWLASVQESNGRWDADEHGAGRGPVETDPNIKDRQLAGKHSDTGLTALCVLAFLGNGNSMNTGPYAVNVNRAVSWLLSVQAADGALSGDAERFEAMYCHGMAALALAEAYAMETDAPARATLRKPLERALAYTVSMQLDDGGWRYLARQEGGGDMSMFGWQLMAFRSAQDGGIPIPEGTRSKMIAFLTQRSRGTNGGLASYRETDLVTSAMTAEAMFCKQMLGMKRDNVMATEAVAHLMQHRPRLAELNFYYWYYGTLAMFQHGGDEWHRWNDALRDLLVREQTADGELAGSWEPRDPYARYGGRLYSTTLSTLCLEVYYRRLPMYQWSGPDAK